MAPILSVCIPSFNRGHLLKRCLYSLINQKMFLYTDDIEIIISDNSSDDDTQKICAEFVRKFPLKIKYFRQEPAIPADDNIAGVSNYANGEYIKMVNDSEILDENFLENTIKLINNHKPDVIFFSNKNIKNLAPLTVCKNADEFVKTVSYFSTNMSCYCYKTEILRGIEDRKRASELKLTQVDIILRILEKGHNALIYNERTFFKIPAPKNGTYNVAQVFGKNYCTILKEHVKKGLISKSTFTNEKKLILRRHIIPYHLHFKKEFKGERGHFFEYTRDFQMHLFYYIYILKILPKFFLRPLSKHKNDNVANTEPQKLWREINPHNKTKMSGVFNCMHVYAGKNSIGEIRVLEDSNGKQRLEIGSYVSLGTDTEFILNKKANDNNSDKSDITIGDDVTIGAKTKIYSGVTIGNGAVIQEGSVVTDDIPPYAVVGGDPAQISQYRFGPEVIEELLSLNTGTLTDSDYQKYVNFLNGNLNKEDVKKVIQEFKSIR